MIASTSKGLVTFKIRDIPLGWFTGTHLYRFEVWWQGNLIKCNVYGDTSFVADSAHVEVDDASNVFYYLDDRILEFSFHDVWGGTQWNELGE